MITTSNESRCTSVNFLYNQGSLKSINKRGYGNLVSTPSF
jgi:hypothetical protein